jgi:hypothetical protein
MKPIVALALLLASLSFAGATPARAQIFHGPDSARQAQKAAKKQQKAYNRANRKQLKAFNKQQKAQLKAARRARRGR